METPQGNFTQTNIYGDYKEVNGIKYAHKLTQSMAGQTFDLNASSVELNGKIDDSLFEIK